MSTFRELLAEVKNSIREVTALEASSLVAFGAVVVDVREADEVASGAVPDAIHIARGMLELQIESKVVNRDTELVIMCAGGTRSALAAKTLQDLGYSSVSSLAGGFDAWKAAGLPWGQSDGLTNDQRRRYQRHLNLPEVGEAGQQRLLDSKVLILGAGGLGSPTALYLAAAGVGTIGIVDDDVVDATNLQRQVIHRLDRVGDAKVDSAALTIQSINPDVSVLTHNTRLVADNVLSLMDGYDVVVDGTDNFDARYLVNDASIMLGIPVVHGSIFRFDGQVSVFDPKAGPSYRDMLPVPPAPEDAPNCSEAGVVGALPGIVGSLQAIETIKLLLDVGEPLIGRLLVFDALEMSFSEYELLRDPDNQITWEQRDQISIGTVGAVVGQVD